MPKPEVLVSTMTLGAGHSIMVSNVPKGLDLTALSEKYFGAAKVDQESVEKYGLFGSDIDYNTYFPDVTPKDFNPEKDEFIEPVYRLLSACVVSKNYMPTEFPADVLKASIPLMIGQTVNCDHETNIGNAIGTVSEAFWQEAYKIGDKSIPAGMNGRLKIDAKANPRIARGINMDPPSIHSNSVTVQFEWKPSHQFKDPYEFWDKLGTYDEKGELVRRIVTRIISYKETSLVSHGADPFAQKLDKDGKIINPGYADSVYNSFSEVVKEKISHSCRAYSSTDYKALDGIAIMYNTSKIINEGNQSSPVDQNPNNNSMNKELQEFLEKLFGEGMLTLTEGASASVELVLSEVKKLIQDKSDLDTKLSEAQAQVTSLTGEVTSLKDAAEANKGYVQMGKDHFKEVKEATVASYKKLVGEGKEDANILTLIESVDSLSTLISLKATYDAQLEEKFPLHCADCGSKNINRGSSVETKENKEDKPSEKSTQEILEGLANKKR